LIELFKDRGLKVGAVKRVHHYSLQPQGKDSDIFLGAGARKVCVVAQEEFLVMERLSKGEDMLQRVTCQFEDYDMVFLEGMSFPGIPVVEVFAPGKEPTLKWDPARLAAVITDESLEIDTTRFRRDDIEAIAGFLEDYDGTQHCFESK
jgi:molybdopterin-guanine dinucleotide biosynthesis protein MobB